MIEVLKSQYRYGQHLADPMVMIDPENGLPSFSHSIVDVSLGIVPGVIATSFSGIKVGLATVNPPDVVSAVARTQPPFAGEAMTVVSDSTADVGVVLRVSALGANCVFQAPFFVTLNGTTPVALPGTISRINAITRASGDIVGNVRVNGPAAQVRGFMEPGASIMRSAEFTIPAGYRYVTETVVASMVKNSGANDSAILSIRSKPALSSVFGPVISFAVQRDGGSSVSLKQNYGTGTLGPTDLQIVAIAGSAGTDVQAYVSGFLVDTSVHP